MNGTGMKSEIVKACDILIVDDDEIVRNLMKEILQRSPHSFNFFDAMDSATALKIAGSNRLDCIILDYILPDGDGISLLEKLKKKNIETPVILVTGHGDEMVAVNALKAGAQDYLKKEFLNSQDTHEVFVKTIWNAVQHHRFFLERRTLEGAVKINYDRYRGIVDHSSLLIIRFFEDDMAVSFVNRSFCDTFSMRRLDVLGENIFDVLPKEDRKAVKRIIKKLSSKKQTESFESEINLNGTKRWIVWTIQALFEDNGSVMEYQFIGADVTDIKVAAESRRFQDELERLSVTLKSMGDGVIITDERKTIIMLNSVAEDLLGYSFKEAKGKKIDSIFRVSYNDSLNSGTSISDYEPVLIDRNGSRRYVAFSIGEIKDQTGINLGDVIIFRDVTDMREMQAQLVEQRQYFQSVLDSQENMIAVVNKDEILDGNFRFFNLFGHDTLAEFKREYRSISDLALDCEGCIYKMEKGNWIDTLLEMPARQALFAFKPYYADSPRIFSATLSRLSIDEERYVIAFSDVTELEKRSKDFEMQASFDTLTKIYNRRKFDEMLVKQIEISKRYRYDLSLVFFDIDHFKRINDRYGHGVGDIILREMSGFVKNNIRKADIFARWGGEEFIMLLPQTSIDDARKIAEKTRIRIEEIDYEQVGRVTCSFGVTQLKMSDTPELFVERADIALYRAKEDGRNRTEVM